MKKRFIYFLIILIFSIFLCGAASAAKINVNNSIGIQNAINTAHSGDTLNLSAGTYKQHDIVVNKNLTIAGPTITGNSQPTAVIDGQFLARVFTINTGSTVTLKNLLILKGYTGGDGGGIYNNGNLTLINCTIIQNGAGFNGGGIFNMGGIVTVNGGSINNNTAQSNGGGLGNSAGTVIVSDAMINGNTAQAGGGIYNYMGTVTLTDSYVNSNTATDPSYYNSGGINNDHGTLNIIRTALNFNSGPYGPIRNNGGTITVTGTAKNPEWQIETVDSPGDVGQATSMAVDSSNNPHILYYDRYVNTWKYAYKENGIWHKETFDNASNYYNSLDTSPNSLVLDILGNPHVIYPSPFGLKYAYKENNTWHTEVVDSNVNLTYFGTKSSIALDTEGNPHISYVGSGGVLYYRFKSDWGWSNPIEIDSVISSLCPSTSIQVDKQDNAHIAYMKMGVGVIYASQGLSQGSFYLETVYPGGSITFAGQDRALSLALDNQGNPHICLYDMNMTGGYFEYVYKDTIWHAEEINPPLARDGCGMYYFSIAVDNQGTPHICYQCFYGDSGNFGETSLRYLTKNANGNWNTIIVDTYPTQSSSISPYNGNIGRYCSMALDSNGNPYISYYDGINKNLMYGHFVDTTPPSVDVNPVGGTFKAPQTVILTTNDQDSPATTYYTTDGSTPNTNSTKYTSPISISTTTTLKYFAVDLAGNPSPVYSQLYTIDMVAPTVTITDPANNAVNVPRNKVITVTFNEPIKAGNLWIELYNTSGTKTTIPITTSISGNVLTINHAALLATGTKYTLALHTGSVTDLTGNSLAGVSRYFTTSTDNTPPTITSTDPTNNAVNVTRNKVITVTFNEPIKAGNMWIELYNTSGTKTTIPITTSISGNVLTINHTALLATGTKYTLALHTGSITDAAGNPVASAVRYFTTGNT